MNHTYWYGLRVIQVVSQEEKHIWYELRYVIWVGIDEGTESQNSSMAQLQWLQDSIAHCMILHFLLLQLCLGLQLELFLWTQIGFMSYYCGTIHTRWQSVTSQTALTKHSSLTEPQHILYTPAYFTLNTYNRNFCTPLTNLRS